MPNQINQNQNPVPIPYQGVNYQGARISYELKRQLEATSAADYLSFKLVDKNAETFVMQAKFPEKGMDAKGNEYDIRINMNYLMRGAARYLFDANGNLDKDKAEKFNSLVADFSGQRTKGVLDFPFPKELLDACDIPPERMENFMLFVEANATAETNVLLMDSTQNNPLMLIADEVEHILEYQKLLHDRTNPDSPETAAELQCLLESYPDVRNTLESYRKMRDMDPLTETEVLYASDCISLASQFELMYQQNREYQRVKNHNDMADVAFQKHVQHMQQREDPNTMAFDAHAYFTLTLTNSPEPVVISLETTAPPIDKLFFRPAPTRTGVGIFRSTEELQEFHQHNNDLSTERAKTVPVATKLKAHIPSAELAQLVVPERMTEDAYRAELAAQGLDPERENEVREGEQMTAEQKSTLHDIQNHYQELMMEDARIAVDSQRKRIEQIAAKYPNVDIDRARLTTKATLNFLTNPDTGSYTKEAQNDPELRAILDTVRKYARMDVTAVQGDYDKERKLITRLREQVDLYLARRDRDMIYAESEDPAFRRRYLVAANIRHFLDVQTDGLLFVPMNDEKAAYVDGTRHAPSASDTMKSAADKPLFPHDPSPNDISQGALGDCYLLSGLSTLASRFPDKIRESMVDNGNGTVTVRFFRKPIDEQTGAVSPAEPVYVTVDKKFPKNRGSEDCLWAQMIERAYVASGLYLNPYNPRPVPENIDQMYQDIASGRTPMPTHEECPWLVDKYNRLHPWKPSYSEIEGGTPANFMRAFLGDSVITNESTPDRYTIEEPNAAKLFKSSLDNFVDGMLDVRRLTKLEGAVDPSLKEPQADWDAASDDTKLLATLLRKKPAQLASIPEQNRPLVPALLGMLVQTAKSYLTSFAAEKAAQTGYENFDWASLVAEYKRILPGMLNNAVNEPKLSEAAGSSLDGMIAMFQDGMATHLPAENPEEAYRNICTTLNAALDQYATNVPSFAPYSGKYPTEEIELYGNLDNALKRGALLNGSTRGKDDKVCNAGIFGGHAYSILGVSQHSLYEGGPELKFIRVRNPHGQTGRRYDVNSRSKKITAASDRMAESGGVFEIELHDFFTNFSSVDVSNLSLDMLLSDAMLSPKEKESRRRGWELQNRPSKAQTAPKQPAPAQPQASANPLADERLTYAKAGELARPIRAAMQVLEGTNSKRFASKEYKAFFTGAERLLLKQALGAQLTGHSMKSAAAVFAQIADLGDAYLKHCADNPRSGSRRETRMKEVSYITNLCRAHAKLMQPEEYMQDKLAEKIGETLLERQKKQIRAEKNADKASIDARIKQLDTRESRKRMVDELKRQPVFQTLVARTDLKHLSNLMLDRKEAIKQLDSIRKELARHPAAAQPVQEAQPQRQSGGPSRSK